MKSCLIGAHTSAAGGVHEALYAGQTINATTIQLFTSNQKRWQGKAITDSQLDKWNKALDETNIKQIMSHASYLINLGSPNEELQLKSRKAFREEWERCIALKLDYLNFHPGSAKDSTEEASLQAIIDGLLSFVDLSAHSPTRLLLECTAGQGNTLGHRFEHLATIIEAVKHAIPIGVCIDTCHAFAAGYDLRNKETINKVLNEFDDIIGLEHLYAFHLNDSQHPLGSRKDRHADLGKGEIGMDCFRILMQDPRVAQLPKYLETPGRMGIWKEEIAILKEFFENSSKTNAPC